MEIPDFNPGTIAYDDFWDEQDRRCIEGYKPTPYMPKITNEHYFYLNMCKIELLQPGATRKTMDYPFYRELDRRLFGEIHDAKKNRYGLIIGKPRRVGLSWVGSTSSFYELLFHEGNRIGVAAGQDDKAQDFAEKIRYLINNVRDEYRSSISTNNSDEIRLSYKYRENKQDMEGGIKSSMYMKTMFANPSGFEGKTLSQVIFEEAGLFQDLIAAYKATEPCFKEGSLQFGTPIVYGTGGDIEKSSEGYMKLWKAKKEVYNLKKVLVTAIDYYPGDGVPDEKTGKTVSFFDFRTGRTNSELALDYILKERKEKEGSEGFIKHIQSYPLKESDIFIKNKGGYLNRKKLNAQKNNLQNCPFRIRKGRLEWKTKDENTLKLLARAKNLKEVDKIHYMRGSTLEFVEDDELWDIQKILDPVKHEKLPFNPDIGGIDSYDDEVEEGGGSLGASIIYRCFHSINKPYNLPIAYTLDRGTSDNDDKYYSNTFRLAVYYDCEMLLEYTKVLIKSYFENVNGLQFLRKRPNLENQGYASKAINQYGFKMSNQHAFSLITRLLKSEVNENYANIWFEEILDHLIDYGEKNSDLGSAYGMVCVHKLDMFGDLSDGIEDHEDDGDIFEDMGHWALVDGTYQFVPYGSVEIPGDTKYDDNEDKVFRNMSIFDPAYDLVGDEKESFEQLEAKKVKEIKEQREKVLEKYGNDIMAFTLEEHQRRLKEN